MLTRLPLRLLLLPAGFAAFAAPLTFAQDVAVHRSAAAGERLARLADVKFADGDTQWFVGPRITW